jgi:hypothetical protein
MKPFLKPLNIERKLVAQGKWLTYETVSFQDPVYRSQRVWEFVQRTGHRSECVDGPFNMLDTVIHPI